MPLCNGVTVLFGYSTLGATVVHPTVIEVGCVADDAEGVILPAGQEDSV
jgi:hypothetical protein